MLTKSRIPFLLSILLAALFISAETSFAQSNRSGSVMFMKERYQNSNFITDMVSDSEGFLWLGTGNGLYRYNGSSYKAFFHGEGESIASNFINSLCPDKDGSIWVGTDIGISRVFQNHVQNYNVGILQVFAIELYGNSHLLLSGYDGLYDFDKSTGVASLVMLDEELADSRIIRSIGSRIWVHSSKHPNRVKIVENGQLIKSLDIKGATSITSIQSFRGKVYLATDKGIKCFTESGDELSLPFPLERFASSNALYCSPDPDRSSINFFIAGEGAFRYFPFEEKVLQIEGIDNLSGVRSCKSITLHNNICYLLNNQDLRFSHEMKSLFLAVQQIPFTSVVKDIYSSQSSRNIIFTTDSGVYMYDIMTKNQSEITPDIPNTGNSIIVNSYIDDSTMWLALSGGNLVKYKLVSTPNRDFKQVSSFDIGTSDIHLWPTTEGSHEVNFVYGTSVFTISEDNQITETTTPFKLSSLPCRSYDGTLYLYGKEGIFVQKEDKSFEKLHIDVNPTAMAADYRGNLWIGTDEDGIYFYDVKEKTLAHYGISDGLPENSVRNILNYKNQIWVAFRGNVSKIDVDNKLFSTILDPDLATFAINYRLRSGTSRFVPMLGDRVIFGNGRGLTCIDPLENQIERDIPISIDGVLSNGDIYLAGQGEELTLDYRHKSLLFYFSGIDYDFGPLLRFSYKLSGYDKEWLYSSSNASAIYSSLPAGNYTFTVRVQLPNGAWGDKEASIRVRIKAHPLLSTPLKALYAAIVLGILGLTAYWIEKTRTENEKKQIGEIESRMNSQLDKEKVDFFTNISHEYRTPLTLIFGPARELAVTEDMSESNRKLLSLIKTNASKMLDLTEEILDFDQISSGTTDKLKVKKTDLSVLLESTANNFGYLFEKKGISYSCDLDDIKNAYCDSSKVLKVVTNFISNAIKYTPEGGSVIVGAKKLDPKSASSFNVNGLDPNLEYVVITVSDTGIGIPKDKIKKIFEKYERIKSQESVGVQGFGVGLNYALHLAEIHKGSILVNSNVPKGTIFSFIFPSSKEAYSEGEFLSTEFTSSGTYAKVIEDSVSEKSIPEKSKDFKVLVVEDNEQLRGFIVDVLEKNFTVANVSDGELAIEYLKENDVDLVLSDLMMPNMDGFTLCQMIKENERTSTLPVILLTAATEDSTKAEGFSKKADAFLSKPFDPDVLRMQIYSIIENRQSLVASAEAAYAVEKDPFEGMSAKDKAFLGKMMSLMEANLANDGYSAATMADDMGISYSKFFYKSKDLLGIAPSEWISAYRLNKAMELLQAGEHNVSEVAFKTGFSSIQSFSRSFKNKFGISPSSV